MPSLGSIPCQTLTTHARASLDLNFESVKKLTQLWILNWRNLPTLWVTTDHGPVESEKVRDRSDQGGIEWSSEGSRSLAGSILLGPPPPVQIPLQTPSSKDQTFSDGHILMKNFALLERKAKNGRLVWGGKSAGASWGTDLNASSPVSFVEDQRYKIIILSSQWHMMMTTTMMTMTMMTTTTTMIMMMTSIQWLTRLTGRDSYARSSHPHTTDIIPPAQSLENKVILSCCYPHVVYG